VYDVVVKKVHVRYLISWWVSCFYRWSIETRRLEGGGSVTGKFSRSMGLPPRTIFARIDMPVNASQLCRWFTQRNFVADYIQVKCNFGRKTAVWQRDGQAHGADGQKGIGNTVRCIGLCWRTRTVKTENKFGSTAEGSRSLSPSLRNMGFSLSPRVIWAVKKGWIIQHIFLKMIACILYISCIIFVIL